MASIRARESGYLYFDFRYRGKRCRESSHPDHFRIIAQLSL